MRPMDLFIFPDEFFGLMNSDAMSHIYLVFWLFYFLKKAIHNQIFISNSVYLYVYSLFFLLPSAESGCGSPPATPLGRIWLFYFCYSVGIFFSSFLPLFFILIVCLSSGWWFSSSSVYTNCMWYQQGEKKIRQESGGCISGEIESSCIIEMREIWLDMKKRMRECWLWWAAMDDGQRKRRKNVLTVGRVDWPSAVIAPQWLTTTTTRSDCLYANDNLPQLYIGLIRPLRWMSFTHWISAIHTEKERKKTRLA